MGFFSELFGTGRAQAPAEQAVIIVNGQPIDPATAPFEVLAPRLRVQLLSPQSRGGLALLSRETLLMRDLCEGLTQVLFYSFGSVDKTVPAADAQRFGKSADELFAIAVANTLRDEPPAKADLLAVGDHAQAIMFVGNGAFVASLALTLDALNRATLDIPAPHGYLVGVPNWHCLLVHIVDVAPEQVVPSLSQLTRKLFDYTDPLSPQVFRVAHGVWTKAS